MCFACKTDDRVRLLREKQFMNDSEALALGGLLSYLNKTSWTEYFEKALTSFNDPHTNETLELLMRIHLEGGQVGVTNIPAQRSPQGRRERDVGYAGQPSGVFELRPFYFCKVAG